MKTALLAIVAVFAAGCTTDTIAPPSKVCDPLDRSCGRLEVEGLSVEDEPLIEICPNNLKLVWDSSKALWKCVLQQKHVNPSARTWCQHNQAHSSPLRPDLRSPECEQ